MLTARCRRSYVLDVAKATRPRKPEKDRLDCFLLGVRFAAASSVQSSKEVFLDTEQFFATPVGARSVTFRPSTRDKRNGTTQTRREGFETSPGKRPVSYRLQRKDARLRVIELTATGGSSPVSFSMVRCAKRAVQNCVLRVRYWKSKDQKKPVCRFLSAPTRNRIGSSQDRRDVMGRVTQ